MKKIITLLILSITCTQNSTIFGMLLKRAQVISKKNYFTHVKQCSNKNAQFDYDEIILNIMQQITALKQENTSLKLTVELLLAQHQEQELIPHTHRTINFVSKDKRSSEE